MRDPSLDDTIREIAAKHGVALGRDDPILILQTMNAKLLAESAAAQQEMLARFREEMESIQCRWGDDARAAAERVLNASLTSGREAMRESLRQGVEAVVFALRQEQDKAARQIAGISVIAKRLAIVNAILAILCALTASIVLLSAS